MAEQRDGSCVVLGLQQARDELHLVGADLGGDLLQADVRLEPRGQHIVVVVPPARRVRPPGERPQCLALLLVGNAIKRQQIGDVAVLESHPARLQAADLRMGCPDPFPGIFEGDSLGLTEASKLCTQQNAQNCRPPRGRDDHRPGMAADRFGSSDHVASRQRPTPEVSHATRTSAITGSKEHLTAGPLQTFADHPWWGKGPAGTSRLASGRLTLTHSRPAAGRVGTAPRRPG